VARSVQNTIEHGDLRDWVQYSWSVVRALNEPESRHVFFEHGADSLVEFHRHEDLVSIRNGGQHVALCRHAELVSAIEATHASVRAEVEVVGERGKLWWADTYDVLDPSWVELNDDAFFASRHSWMYGPCFGVDLQCPDLDAVEGVLASLLSCERRPPLKTLELCGPRWVSEVPGLEHRIGFHFRPPSSYIWFPPRQIGRACRLSDPEGVLPGPGGRCPTAESRSFFLWLTALIQHLSKATRIDFAVLMDEAARGPSCVIEPGWAYVYAWAEIGEPTSDRLYNRIPLGR
jgi:hypothetical protein